MARLPSAAALLVVLWGPTPAAWAQAQTQIQTGSYAIPSLSLTEEYDDNLFATRSGRKSDFITRVTPGITLGHRSAVLKVEGSYSLDSELYARNSDLNDATVRQRANASLEYLATPVLTLALGAAYTETETPTDLLLETGIELGRRSASQVSVEPRVSYRFDPVTSGDTGYSYSRTTLSGGVTNTTHRAELKLTRELSPVDHGAVRYRLSVFESEGTEAASSHAVTLGWIRQFTEATTASLSAGPRVSDDGAVNAEVSVQLDHRFRLGTASLAYTRTDTTVIGRTGPVTADIVAASLTLEPLRALQVRLGASFRRSSGDDEARSPETRVYGANAAVSYRLTGWMTARLTYRFAHEEAPETIRHHIVAVGLDFAYPVRLR